MTAADQTQGTRAKDHDGLEERIRLWLDECRPTDVVERELATRAARASWALDGLDRCEAALLSRRVRKARLLSKAKQIAQAADLGRRLFTLRGSTPGRADDDPSALVAALEGSSEGVRWLLDRWAEIRNLIASDASWTFLDQLRFVRLLGKQPFNAVDDPELNRLFLAWEVVEEGWGVRFWQKMREATPLEDPAFSAWRQWREIAPRPADAAAAVATLLGFVDRETARLEALLSSLDADEARDADDTADAASFSPGDAAERRRRHRAVLARELIKAVETLSRHRKEAAKPEPRKPPGPRAEVEAPATAPPEPSSDPEVAADRPRVAARGVAGKAEGPRGRPSGLRGQGAATGSRVRTSSSSTSAGLRRATGSPG